MPPLLLSLRPSPSPRLPLRLLLFRCSASATPSTSLASYHASFARRMALAGIHPHHRIAMGISGGPDSMALCVLATAWKKAAVRKAADKESSVSSTFGSVSSAFVDGLLGVVVDHGLRPESADEARLVRDRVRGMGVECEIARCKWPDGRPKQGHVQEAAREFFKSIYFACGEHIQIDKDPYVNKFRYQKLLDICIKQQIGILLIAHHSDDQANSFSLKLFTVLQYGYAVIDLEKLDPLNVDDLCLSQYLAYILQFVSQRHRPLRGRSARLLLDYIRTIPCKAALTVAGCYLCAAPRSKGTKVLVCCSVDWMESSSAEISYKCSYEEQAPPVPEIDQIVLEGLLQSNQFIQNHLDIPFVYSKSSIDVLNKAKDLNIIDDFTLEKLCYMRTDEHDKFIVKEHKNEDHDMEETKFPDCNVLRLCPGETCHFMSRFLITWEAPKDVNEICLHENKEYPSKICTVNLDGSLEVRHMVDADWLFLADVCNIRSVEEILSDPKASSGQMEMDNSPQHYRYLQRSAQKALQNLRSIPAAARRTLPVLTNVQGDIVCIPSIGFRCCPSLPIQGIFCPRVPLGGGYSSYL
ncbi:hypothetical protein BAE44_0016090 [Dichanthelium oligosanthes]|uniref:tRNA(Ile)-lysidine synthetase n=1 Tax=Dichanthelium oligosanthes TaxID=888268 RepID=A0A1E5VCM7_9POAL|nr:hypothetical protein BAE44_0016090 [Dichanthelium oligosanthes]